MYSNFYSYGFLVADSSGSSGSSGAVIGGAVGGVVVIAVIIIVVILVLIYMRQLHQKKSNRGITIFEGEHFYALFKGVKLCNFTINHLSESPSKCNDCFLKNFQQTKCKIQ